MRLTRSAFTLVEIIIAVAIAGVAGSAITLTLVRQQRFFSSAASVLDVRSQLRDGADVLVGDLRGAAVARFGIRAVEDSMIEFYATIATSVACAGPSGATIALPPQVLSRGNSLTSILFVPDTADVALLYGVPSGVPDSGRWETQRIASFASRAVASTCPSSSGFTTAFDGAGVEVPSPTGRVAQIDVILRGQTARAASLDGDLRRIYRDSVVLTVSPRNRR